VSATQNTEWVKVEDWATVDEGQRVMLGGDGIKLPATITAVGVGAWGGEWLRVLFAGMSNDVRLDNEGWSLFIEKPKVQLPTEPGIYADMNGTPWMLRADSEDMEKHWRFGDDYMTAAEADEHAPFTLLRPVAEVAAEVLAEVRAELPGTFAAYDYVFAGIAAQFEVTQ